jgi:hypothetical protein
LFQENQESSTNNARSMSFKKFEKNHLADSLQEENSSESEESNQESDDDKMEDDSDSDSNEVRDSQQVSRFGHEHHPQQHQRQSKFESNNRNNHPAVQSQQQSLTNNKLAILQNNVPLPFQYFSNSDDSVWLVW